MKKHLPISFLFLTLLGIYILSSCSSTSKNTNKSTYYRLIHNNDGSDMLGNYWFDRRPISVADLDSCVDMVTMHSQVTTYMICTGSDFFYYRSKYGRTFGDDLNGTLNCGTDTAQYKSFYKFYLNHLRLEKEGTDMVATTLKRAKERGMETFITYRMNDLHFNDTIYRCPIFYTDFWYKHPEYWVNDNSQGYHSSGALDFAHKEVRDRKLAIISEQLEKYDTDGLDLDFMRFFVYFKPGEGQKNTELMTQLLRDIRKKVNETAALKHKKILLSVRVAPTLEENLSRGLDIREWLKEGLLDFISISLHWRGDPALPVAAFRKTLGKDLNIPFYATVDDGAYKPREQYSHGMYRGMCSHILSQGADGVYLFNYYFGEYNHRKVHHIDMLQQGEQCCRVMDPVLLKELGSLKTLEGRNKIYFLSDGMTEYQLKPNTPLPLYISPKKRQEANIYVGDEMKKVHPKEVILFIRTFEPTACKLTINGKVPIIEEPSYTKLYDRELGLMGNEKEYAFIIPTKAIKHGYNKIIFSSPDGKTSYSVKRIEMALKYGDVKTNGYF